MNFKKAINYEQLKDFFESKGFIVKSGHGGVVFTSQYGHSLAIFQPWKDSNMIYLDSTSPAKAGLQAFQREFPERCKLA